MITHYLNPLYWIGVAKVHAKDPIDVMERGECREHGEPLDHVCLMKTEVGYGIGYTCETHAQEEDFAYVRQVEVE